jgi:hypothetical protein
MMYSFIFIATALWHLLAAYHFILYPARTLARISKERPVNSVAIEAVRFLGAINIAFVVLGVGGCFVEPGSCWLVALVLLCANLSQALVDMYAKRAGMASGPFFQQILIGDFVFAGANALCLFSLFWSSPMLA